MNHTKAQKIAVAGVVLLIIIGMVVAYKKSNNAAVRNDTNHNGEVPVFAWRFTQATTNNPDGNPQTNIFLDATYANGKKESKMIALTDGSCNELPDSAGNLDILPGTKVIQCYYAGLGAYFKITKGLLYYQVQVREFEEGSDEYIPKIREFVVIADFEF